MVVVKWTPTVLMSAAILWALSSTLTASLRTTATTAPSNKSSSGTTSWVRINSASRSVILRFPTPRSTATTSLMRLAVTLLLPPRTKRMSSRFATPITWTPSVSTPVPTVKPRLTRNLLSSPRFLPSRLLHHPTARPLPRPISSPPLRQ